ncbi:AEC family transporter [Arsenicitalea aurantiaca]|uniref:AEC family transporter n=1 Tax=Arsenicitalea aurantiaca TaxID=1783274 RepID=A0A433XB16_9HYPH|nr:AEC family transporter [Arsenicitalea aurantiaca]RUT31244.1 AEC family transporter [Arsenicitalea aurantiaca]
MFDILNVVAPVFALMALGYFAVRHKLYPASGVAGLVAFVNNFATPCLLFNAMLTVDFGTAFMPGLILPFYFGAIVSLAVGAIIAVRIFKRRPGEGVSAGFSAMFTNTVLVGVPILQRAYGDEAMPIVYSIVALHAPVLISLSMVIMELVRRDGTSLGGTLLIATKRVVMNPLLWGVAAGLAFNALGITLIEPAEAVVTMLAMAVFPAALFGLGGALNAYRLADNWTQALAMSILKLIVQPAIAWVIMVPMLGVDPDLARYAVLLAAMPAGINVYVFATYYNRAVDVATNTILISTVASVVTVPIWLALLSL